VARITCKLKGARVRGRPSLDTGGARAHGVGEGLLTGGLHMVVEERERV
jgi:hypothetical protein